MRSNKFSTLLTITTQYPVKDLYGFCVMSVTLKKKESVMLLTFTIENATKAVKIALKNSASHEEIELERKLKGIVLLKKLKLHAPA
jgi:hypothetical protein